jgi:hypothetical protein
MSRALDTLSIVDPQAMGLRPRSSCAQSAPQHKLRFRNCSRRGGHRQPEAHGFTSAHVARPVKSAPALASEMGCWYKYSTSNDACSQKERGRSS